MNLISRGLIRAANFINGGVTIPITRGGLIGLGSKYSYWNNLQNNADYLKAYLENPCVSTPIKILSDAGFVNVETVGRSNKCYYLDGLDFDKSPAAARKSQAG